MINLLHCGSQIDAVGFYRGWGPLTTLEQTWPEFRVRNCPEVNWGVLKRGQIIYLERPTNENYLQVIKMARLNEKKVWIDYDDDLFNIPPSNQRNNHLKSEETAEIIKSSLNLADLVTVSTPALRNEFAQYCQRIEVVPNAYDKNLYPYRLKNPPPRKKIIFWRGSETHDQDLEEVTPQLIEAAKSHPEYEWAFIGAPSWRAMEEFKKHKINHTKIPEMEPVFYMKFIYEMRPAIMIVPLTNNKLNQSKSNIAWIEGTHAGSYVVATTFPEWQRPGIRNYGSHINFIGALTETIEVSECGLRNEASENYIEENLLLDKINLQRKKLILSLL